ncbi:MAG: hypothetical protein ACR2MT_13790 [Aurantibacter sp.]
MLALFSMRATAQDITLLGLQFDHSNAVNAYHSVGGLRLEGLLGKHFSIGYTALYSPLKNDEYYFYTSAGHALGVFLIRDALEKRSGLGFAIPVGIIAFVLPDNYAYRFSVGEKSQLAIFTAPYGFDYVKNKISGEEDYDISYEAGLRYYLKVDNWLYLTPQVGAKGAYGKRTIRPSFGLSVLFKVKEE